MREADGLALSSRNVYLTEAERAQAVHINKGLALAESLVREGECDAAVVLAAVQEYFAAHMPNAQVEYLECVHPDQLEAVACLDAPALLATAVRFSRARLIDNRLVGGA